jgi:hypothetical protein
MVLFSQSLAKRTTSMVMQPYQWFLMGLMASWTPSLVILAVMLSRAGDGDGNGQHGYARSIRSVVASTGIPRKVQRLVCRRESRCDPNMQTVATLGEQRRPPGWFWM